MKSIFHDISEEFVYYAAEGKQPFCIQVKIGDLLFKLDHDRAGKYRDHRIDQIVQIIFY